MFIFFDNVVYNEDLYIVFTAKDKITWDLELGRNSEIVLNITVKNDGESAFEAKLFVAAPENLHFISYKAGVGIKKCIKSICIPHLQTGNVCWL